MTITTLARSLKDTGRRIRLTRSGVRVEGEWGTETEEGEPFPCLLTVQSSTEPESGRAQDTASLIVGPEEHLVHEDEVVIDSTFYGPERAGQFRARRSRSVTAVGPEVSD